jgi:hypothetical protein
MEALKVFVLTGAVVGLGMLMSSEFFRIVDRFLLTHLSQ